MSFPSLLSLCVSLPSLGELLCSPPLPLTLRTPLPARVLSSWGRPTPILFSLPLLVCSCLAGLPVSRQHSHLAMAPACLEPQSQPTVIQGAGRHAHKVSALEAQRVRILNAPSKMNKKLLPELPEGLIVQRSPQNTWNRAFVQSFFSFFLF